MGLLYVSLGVKDEGEQGGDGGEEKDVHAQCRRRCVAFVSLAFADGHLDVLSAGPLDAAVQAGMVGALTHHSTISLNCNTNK